jgi:hypothetical protein
MHDLHETPDQNIFGFTLSGTLTEDDYEAMVPFMTDKLERYTTVRILFQLDDVDGWEPESLWDEWAFDLRHARDVDKVAVVGEEPWETWLSKLEVLFPTAQTQFYDEADEAWDWLRGGMDVPGIGPGSVPEPQAGAQDESEEAA